MMNKSDEQRDRDRSKRDRPSRFSEKNRDRSRERRSKDNRVYVSNIPYDYKWTDVKDLFREKVGEVAYVELFNDENDKPRGCGIVEFSNPESITKAMEVMHRFPIQGRKLVIKEDSGQERDKFGYLLKGSGDPDRKIVNRTIMPRIQDSTDQYNTYGLNAQFLESLAIQGPLCNRVFVANLYFNVDKAKLKEVFKMAGKVRNIDLSLDKDGNSRGFAVIEYDHPVEAVQAISMFDKQFLYDRKMAVRMDRVGDKPEIRLPEGLKGIGVGLGPNGEPLHDVARTVTQNLASTNQQPGLAPGILGNTPTNVNMNTLAANMIGNNAGFQQIGMTQNQFMNQVGMGQTANTMSVGNMQNGFMGNGNLGGNFNRSPMTPNISSFQTQSNMGRQNNQFGMDLKMDSNNKVSEKIQINNLPSNMTWKLLREKFGECGDIKFADKLNPETGVIRFSSEWEAERAIKLFDGTRIEGRTIEVRFY